MNLKQIKRRKKIITGNKIIKITPEKLVKNLFQNKSKATKNEENNNRK